LRHASCIIVIAVLPPEPKLLFKSSSAVQCAVLYEHVTITLNIHLLLLKLLLLISSIVVLHLDAEDLGLGEGEMHLELGDLLLEVGDGADAAVDRVPQARVGLVHQAAHRVRSLLGRKFLESDDPYLSLIGELMICRYDDDE
jgi:hypothetical protein